MLELENTHGSKFKIGESLEQDVLAVVGAKTKNGGIVIETNNPIKINGKSIALVGDDVLYADGRTAKIIAGTDKNILMRGKSIALVGSQVEGNDEIISTPICGVQYKRTLEVTKLEGV